jgi:hypothetical protein
LLSHLRSHACLLKVINKIGKKEKRLSEDYRAVVREKLPVNDGAFSFSASLLQGFWETNL